MSHIEVFPFHRFSWRSREIRDKWEPIRRRIYDATYHAEYEMVKRGYRDADVYQLDPDKFDIQIKRVELDGLVYLPILRSKTYGGFGHRHYTTDKIDANTFIYGVMAKDLETAILFHDASVTHPSQTLKHDYDKIDHNIIGKLLGYPECDREFFDNVWLKGGCLDPMFEVAMNTEGVEVVDENHVKVGGHAYLNRFIRYFGFQVIPYFSHSFDCEEAIKFAVKWFGIMREYDQKASDKCVEILSMPMKWSLMNCITYVEHPLFIGAANGYYTPEKRVVEWLP